MATTINDFSKAFRSLRYTVSVDLNNDSILEDYTDQLDVVTWLDSIKSGLPCGIVETTCDIVLIQDTYNIAWQKSGLKVKVCVLTSSDNWVTESEVCVFQGVTTDKSVVTDKAITLRCVGNTTALLDRKRTGGSTVLTGAREISTLIENETNGAGFVFETLPLTGYTISDPFFFDGVSRLWAINQLCLAGNYIFRNKLGTEKTMDGISCLGSEAIIDDATIVTYKLDHIINYQSNQNSSYTYNRVRNNAYIRKYLINQQIYNNKNITGIEIKANSTLYYTIDDKDLIDYFIIENFVAFTGSETVSYYQCATADDGTGLSNAGISLVSGGIVVQGNKTKVLLVLNNTNGSSRWLKYVGVYGFAGFIVNNIIENDDRDTTAINNDGKEYFLDYDSRYIQSQAQAQSLSNELQSNYPSTKKTYQFNAKGRPNVQVGDVIKFQTRDEVYHYGLVLELDNEISRDRGYEQTILVKEV